MVLAGKSLWAITKWLNAEGYVTAPGGKWKTQVLRRTLLRTSNIGVRTHRQMKNGKHVGPVATYKGQWDPIVDEDRYVRMKSILTDPSRKTNNRGTDPLYLLTNVARCGACGESVVGTKEYTYDIVGALRKDGTRGPSRQRVYPAAYKCVEVGCMRVQRGMFEVDALVTGTIIGVLERDGVEIFGGNADEAAASRDEAETLRARLAVAADQFADGLIEGEQLARISQKLKPQISAADARYAAAQPAPTMSRFTGSDVKDAWDEASIEVRKALIATIEMTITILPIGSGNGNTFDHSKVEITW